MPEFYIIRARKIIKVFEFYDCYPKKINKIPSPMHIPMPIPFPMPMRVPPPKKKNREKYFSGNCHAKFRHFVNFFHT